MKTETLVAAPPARIACLALPKLIGSGNLDAATGASPGMPAC